MDLYRRAQPEEEGLYLSGQLGGVVHVDDEVRASCAVHVRKVGRLRLDFLHYGLEGLRETSVLNSRVGLLRRYAGTYHEAHALSLSLSHSLSSFPTRLLGRSSLSTRCML